MLQDRLLDIALHEFGAHGLDGASTRRIAAAAATAMSSITYHYGGKEGLYLAAADHVAQQMTEQMEPALRAEAGAAENPDAARAAIHRLLAGFLAKMAGEHDADAALFIMREQMNPTEAFDRIYGGIMGRMLATLVDLVCTATQMCDLTVSRVTTVTLMGQVLALRASRASCLRLLERDRVDEELIAAFQTRIAANIDAILDRLIADTKGTS